MENNIEEKIIDLEIRITQQEDMIDELNKTIYRQQMQLEDFEKIIKELASRIIQIESEKPINEKPPHY